MPMPCPRCAPQPVVLTARTARSVSVQACLCCNGLWIGHRTFKELVVDAPARAEIDHTDGRPAEDPGVTLACPECAAAMARGAIGGLVIDTCAEHGMWFDADELGATLEWALAEGYAEKYRGEIEALRHARDRRVSVPPPPVRSVEPHAKVKARKAKGDGGWFEGIVVIFEILGAILEIFA